MKKVKYLLIILSLIMTASDFAYGCLCTYIPENAKDALDESEAVFAGKIVSVERGKGFDLFTFNVESVWKGISGKTVVLQDYSENSSCTKGLKVGERYIVFSSFTNDFGKLISLDINGKPRPVLNTCGWTSNLTNPQVNKKIIKKIGKGKPVNQD